MSTDWKKIFKIIGEFLKKLLTIQGLPVWAKIVIYALLALIAILAIIL